MIIDQRTMLLLNNAATPEEVVGAWDAFVADPRFPGFTERHFEREFIQATETIVADVSRSRWVGICPHCNGGIALWPGTSHGGACYDCGRIYTSVDYPAEGEIAQATDLLKARPATGNANWERSNGETLEDLAAQNTEAGL